MFIFKVYSKEQHEKLVIVIVVFIVINARNSELFLFSIVTWKQNYTTEKKSEFTFYIVYYWFIMYQPSPELLKKYADVLVKFALRGGEGVKQWDVVFVQIPECAKPFYLPLQKSILEAGAHPIFEYYPDGVSRHFYEHAADEQITFYPEHFLHGKVQQMTHVISVIAEADKYELKGVDPQKMAARVSSRKPYIEKRTQKELEGKMTWTLGLYGTPAMAEEVWMSLEEYRKQIINACYLDEEKPIEHWKKVNEEIETIITKLNTIKIQKVHMVGQDVDLWVGIWSDRKWLGGSGRNIPSFEIFTSPDYRQTSGWMKFNQPLYRYGQKITGISLKFEKGEVIEFDAQEGKDLLTEIFEISGTKSLGEFSLTDGRHSRITKAMGETLYDENMWGPFGNTHVAIGRAYEETYTGDVSSLSAEQRKELWFNQSAEHIDIISTTDRTVTAYLEDWSEKIIYQDGKFII